MIGSNPIGKLQELAARSRQARRSSAVSPATISFGTARPKPKILPRFQRTPLHADGRMTPMGSSNPCS